jgi:protein tyrosine kinase modulator
MPVPKADNNYPQFSLLSLARMCWMHRWGIVLGWAILTAVIVAIVYRLPAIYSAEALILIDAQKIPERFVPTTVSAETEDRLASISQEILSNTRLKKIIDDYDLYREERKTKPLDDVVQMMRKDISSHVKLERGFGNGKPAAFRVGYEGQDPALVAQVANQLANLFIEENLRAREGQAEGTSEFIGMQVADAKKKLDALETRIREFKTQYNGELPEQQNGIEGNLNRLQMEQVSNRDAIARAEETKATLQRTMRLAEETLNVLLRPAATPEEAAAAGVKLAPPSRKLSEVLMDQLQALSARYGPQYPDVKRLREEIARAKAAEERQASQGPAPDLQAGIAAPGAPRKGPAVNPNAMDVGQARERVETMKSQIALLDKEIASRQADQQRIAREFADTQKKLGEVPLREQELGQITRDYEITKLNYHSLLEKQISAEMSTDMERRQKSERFTIIDPAHVPEMPSKPNRPFFITIGSMFGLVLTMAGALGTELRRDRLLGEWELPQNISVLARVPVISMPGRGRFWSGWKGAGGIAAVSSALLGLAFLAVRLLSQSQ